MAGPWALDEVWPDDLSETNEPATGEYNRAALAIFVLAKRWKDFNSPGTAKPPQTWLLGEVNSSTSPVTPTYGRKEDYPPVSEARNEFQKLWTAMKDQIKGMHRLGLSANTDEWKVQSGNLADPNDALANTEKKVITDAILTL